MRDFARNIILPASAMTLFAFAEKSRLLEVAFINPNLIIIGITILSFVSPSITPQLGAAVASAIALKMTPGFEMETIAVFAAAIFSYIFSKALPFRSLIAFLTMLCLNSVVFYAAHAPLFLGQAAFLKELIYNIALGFILYFIAQPLYAEERRS